MIRVIRRPGYLELRGHAGTAPRGHDLVCAGVSILAETLCASLPPGSVTWGEGLGIFSFPEPCPAADTVCTGLRLLAEQYPQAVGFSEEAEEDQD